MSHTRIAGGDSATDRTPKVSALFPLYRSASHLEILVDNLETLRALDRTPVEIIVSDRHGLDDALASLRARFGADRRFRFLEGRDGLSWVEHVNLLIREARGSYFVVIPHDDTFPAEWIPTLASVLEQAPDAVVAFGDIERIDLEGRPLARPFAPPPPARAWTLAHALRLLLFWNPGIAWRGVVRRDTVIAHDLYMREAENGFESDIYWIFALALRGRLVHVPAIACRKRFYPASTHAALQVGIDRRGYVRRFASSRRVLAGYLRDHAGGPFARLAGNAALSAWLLLRLFRRLLPRGGRLERTVLACRRLFPNGFTRDADGRPRS